MITIYHNPRCTKSREGLAEIEALKKPYAIRKYIDEPFTKEELTEVIQKLEIKPLELVRTKEKIWIQEYKGKNMSDVAIIEAMLLHPKLIERPIVVNEGKAIIARPKEMINKIIGNI
ncbi:arsenate reductase (glutaredoxin) [Flavobacterium jejuense]|uniref:Arsenate reductase (Glutaredoxin) n=1 Tax=Flavobacterium jejuense TaxID=1544455 RepID=A0ABX0IUQ5_9FLAO|nr:arsenate reductase (glutaredoxin) [Flavobacterium jejuense]NHN27542.1 arsenate reductase (glutaredoxin) [Flavobacterium jejuense]